MNATVTIPVYSGRRDRAPKVIAHVLLDAADAAWAMKHHWTLNQGYASRRTPRPEGRAIPMHRDLVGLEPGDPLVADHINRHKLDCRRRNLRVVTRSQNCQNKDAYRNGRSRFRGVSWHSGRGIWRATAQVNGEWTFIGRFATEEEAGKAAAEWRRKHMPFSFEEAAAA